MRKGWIVALLLLLAVGGGLVALDIVPLGGADSDDGTSHEAADGLAGGVDDEVTAAASLEGRGDGVVAEAPTPEAAPPVPTGPAIVSGTTPGGSRIEGRVVFREGGAPASGVRVRLTRPDSISCYLRAAPNGRYDVLEAFTAADGRFTFRDVTPSDKYVVRARLESHAVVSSESIDVRGGASADVGDLVLGPAAAMSGRVLDSEGKPVADARVALTWAVRNPLGVILADPDTLPEVEAEVQTDAKGAFLFEGLEPGSKTVLAHGPTGASAMIRSIALPDGETVSGMTLQFKGRGALAGRVAWSDGRPIENARVFAGPEQRAVMRTSTTDAEGRFRIPHLPGDTAILSVLIPGLPVRILQGQRVGTENVEVTFPAPGLLRGVVVTESDGQPLPRFSVAADPEDFGDMQARFIHTFIAQAIGPTPFRDEEGRFEMKPLAPGKYTLRVRAPGFPEIRKKGVVVEAGVEPAPVRIELPRGEGATGVATRADNGEAVEGARIFVVRRDLPPEPQASSPEWWADVVDEEDPIAISDLEGAFTVPPQAPGAFHIVAVHEELRAGVLPSVDLSRGNGSDLRIELAPAGRVTGRCVTATGAPASGQTIALVRRDSLRFEFMETDDEGRFTFPRVEPGKLLVLPRTASLSRLGVLRSRTTDEVEQERIYEELRESADQEHALVAGGEVTARVKLAHTVEVSGALRLDGVLPQRLGIWITIDGGGWGQWVEPLEGGRYKVRLEPGTYVVWLPGPENNWASETIEVPNLRTWSRDFERRAD